MIAFLLLAVMLVGTLFGCGGSEDVLPGSDSASGGTTGGTPEESTTPGSGDQPFPNEGSTNRYLFTDGERQVTLELCSPRTVRLQYSMDGENGYRPEDPEYYMVQKDSFALVKHSYTEDETTANIRTLYMELRIEKSPFRISMYDTDGNLMTADSEEGVYQEGGQVGIRKTEGTRNAGGIFGFGSGDHGRRSNLNRYDSDFTEFSMSHGRVIAPFFMSSVGYGVFLNTISENTTFYKHGGGFETEGYLDYFMMYGPDFKTVLNEYAELTGRMELYGKWALGFMLSKYGNDNATQAEFLEWIHRLRDEGYPADCYVFDYGWRGDINVTKANYGAGQKWGNQMWSNDKTKFPDIAAMFREARELGFHVGLHNNAGTPEASGGDKLYLSAYEARWVKSYMDSVITTGFGDWFWPDEFDVLGSNTAPVFSAKGAYEAWKEFTDANRPMFVTRGSYAGQHFATAWSGDTDATESDLAYQIGYALDTGLVGYWATSCDLGGFKSRPSDALYTRWVSEFGAWSAIMRTHGHDGREPWSFDKTAQNTLKQNLKLRYSLYPYLYTSAWQGYSAGVPMMRAMILEDGSQTNPDAWDLNRQYYFGDWFLVAPATEAADTTVSVWFPPNTTWYNYYTGERYEGGADGKTVRLEVALDEIPVFVKAGAIIPMGPEVNYADELPLDPLTLDIYPKGRSSYTFYEDDGVSRKYQTENAYTTTTYTCVQDGGRVTLTIGARQNHNAALYTPVERSYNIVMHHLSGVSSVTLDGVSLRRYASAAELENAVSGFYTDGTTLTIRFPDNAEQMELKVVSDRLTEPAEGEGIEVDPDAGVFSVADGALFELEDAVLNSKNGGDPLHVNTEWKGYTGKGFVKPFRSVGDNVSFVGKLTASGAYDLIVRVNCGKKNDAKFDGSDRTGALYIDGVKVKDLSFAVTETWGDSNKNGVWLEYVISGITLSAGKHTFSIAAEGCNPGNYNLDSVRFRVSDNSVNGFERVEAENASVKKDFRVSGTGAVTTTDGAYLGFASVRAEGKKKFEITLSSTTGGVLTVYETGVGDKILATVEFSGDGKMQTITVECRDTDLNPSPIYLEFRAKNGQTLQVSVDWFRFIG